MLGALCAAFITLAYSQGVCDADGMFCDVLIEFERSSSSDTRPCGRRPMCPHCARVSRFFRGASVGFVGLLRRMRKLAMVFLPRSYPACRHRGLRDFSIGLPCVSYR